MAEIQLSETIRVRTHVMRDQAFVSYECVVSQLQIQLQSSRVLTLKKETGFWKKKEMKEQYFLRKKKACHVVFEPLYFRESKRVRVLPSSCFCAK